MAVQFIQRPTDPNGTQATIVYSLTNLSLLPQAKYICDVKATGSNETLVRIKQPSNASNFGVFELSDVLHDYTDWDEVWTTPTIVSSSNNNTRSFSIEFGQEFGTSPSSSLTIQPSQITSSITVYPAVEELVDGMNWQSGSYFNDFLSNSPLTQSVRLEDYGTLSHFNLSNSFVESYRVTIYNESNSILALLRAGENERGFGSGGHWQSRTITWDIVPHTSGSARIPSAPWPRVWCWR